MNKTNKVVLTFLFVGIVLGIVLVFALIKNPEKSEVINYLLLGMVFSLIPMSFFLKRTENLL